ncbi:TIGR03086 family metal-binding protein [Prauserella cavernicola]|uniref:TIGR03086 family protein n=1 Tax=Prauserella cavernicola TaxID=2800127 RepID=A0A934QVY5_9PSEU|nr:TIGR03086 family metal-binding protein [Prauserella cavernicola]MBK1787398.1 TIGR03086 family protein [Prauserella cavernicola]
MDELTVLRRAVTEFDRRLRDVAGDRWRWPTPCESWTVLELVEHVANGNRMAVLLLNGATADRAAARVRRGGLTADAAAGDLRDSAEEQARAFAEHGALQRLCQHPADRISGREFALYRAGDIAVHAWDLARATGTVEALDHELVAVVLTTYLPWVTALGPNDQFDPGHDPGGSPQERLLTALGRRP